MMHAMSAARKCLIWFITKRSCKKKSARGAARAGSDAGRGAKKNIIRAFNSPEVQGKLKAASLQDLVECEKAVQHKNDNYAADGVIHV